MKLLNDCLLKKIITFFLFLILFSNFSIISIGQQHLSQNSQNSFEKITVKYNLLIIAPEEFSEYLQPLVEHKNQNDVKTKLATTQEIYDYIYWPASDEAEEIKLYIKEAKEQLNIKYVLLVGGRKDQSKNETWWVPVRYTNVIRDYPGYENFSEGDFLTDLYFADIYDNEGNFSSWDDDNDGIFGEWYDHEIAEDIPDLYPDARSGHRLG